MLTSQDGGRMQNFHRKDRKKNADSSAIIAAKHEDLLAAKRSAKRKADEWVKLFFI